KMQNGDCAKVQNQSCKRAGDDGSQKLAGKSPATRNASRRGLSHPYLPLRFDPSGTVIAGWVIANYDHELLYELLVSICAIVIGAALLDVVRAYFAVQPALPLRARRRDHTGWPGGDAPGCKL